MVMLIADTVLLVVVVFLSLSSMAGIVGSMLDRGSCNRSSMVYLKNEKRNNAMTSAFLGAMFQPRTISFVTGTFPAKFKTMSARRPDCLIVQVQLDGITITVTIIVW